MRAALLAAFVATANAINFIYPFISDNELEQVRRFGEDAKIKYVQIAASVTDEKEQRSHYLDGLEACNSLGREETSEMLNYIKMARPRDAQLLEKAGMKEFTASFMTLPTEVMITVARKACIKHEKQLQCGSVFEGNAVTKNRIEELKTIGNHRMMFEKECADPSFVPRVYPCIGRDAERWIAPCRGLVDTYYDLRERSNAEIAEIYDTALTGVKRLYRDQAPFGSFLFHRAMESISKLEGKKCAQFKQMRVCVLKNLLHTCGVEAVRSFNASISEGYLRTERRERLSLDFQVFNYPSHPNCVGL